MRSISIAKALGVVTAVWWLAVPSSHAYVDIELTNGSHVKGESFSSEAGKLVVYRPSGAVEIDRSTVRAIREIEGSSSYETIPSAPSAPSVSTAAVPSAAPSVPPPAAKVETKDPQEREHQLAHQLIHVRLDRLAASQRGDQDTMKKLDQEIGALQKERIENYKKIDPSFDPESSKE